MERPSIRSAQRHCLYALVWARRSPQGSSQTILSTIVIQDFSEVHIMRLILLQPGMLQRCIQGIDLSVWARPSATLYACRWRSSLTWLGTTWQSSPSATSP